MESRAAKRYHADQTSIPFPLMSSIATKVPADSDVNRDQAHHRNKLVAGLLGLLVGVTGLHRLYLGQRGWWLFPVLALPAIGHALRQPEWFREWTFFLFALLAVIAWAQTIIVCVMTAETFNARFNGGSASPMRGGGLAVVVAVIALMLGTTTLMAVMALALEGVFAVRGS